MSAARCSPDGRLLAVCDGIQLIIYRVDITANRVTRISAKSEGILHQRPINDFAWSPCSRYVASGGADGLVIMWRVHREPAMPERSADLPGTHSLEKNKVIDKEGYTNTDTPSIDRVMLDAGRVYHGHEGPVTCLTFNRKGNLLVSGSEDERAIVWSVRGGVLWRLLNAHSQALTSVDITFDSQLVLTASADGYVRVWNMVDGLGMRVINGCGWVLPVISAKFTPNGKFVLVKYTDGQTRMINIVTKAVRRRFGKITKPYGYDKALNREERPYISDMKTVRPDMLYIADMDGIRVYDTRTKRELNHFLPDIPITSLDVFDGQDWGVASGPQGVFIFKTESDEYVKLDVEVENLFELKSQEFKDENHYVYAPVTESKLTLESRNRYAGTTLEDSRDVSEEDIWPGEMSGMSTEVYAEPLSPERSAMSMSPKPEVILEELERERMNVNV